ncbi:hypothetical protein BJX76DRAFT_337632 [Aspergillus varians]
MIPFSLNLGYPAHLIFLYFFYFFHFLFFFIYIIFHLVSGVLDLFSSSLLLLFPL